MASLPRASVTMPRAQRALLAPRLRVARPPSQRCAGLSEVGAYLLEAVEHVFQTEPSTAPFKASSFSGPISHDDHGRLRKIYKLVKKATPEDPSAATVEACEETAEKQKRYLQGALEKVFSSKTEEEPDKWVVQPFEGNITSKREIERMLYMERVMRKTLEAADKQQ